MTYLELRDTPEQGTDFLPTPQPCQRTTAVGDYVRDVAGLLWLVRKVRPTKLGFDLCFGSLAYGLPRGHIAKGRPTLIGTHALVAHWRSAGSDTKAGIGLPVGRNTLPNLCRRLGLRRQTESQQVWRNPIADLKKLPVCEFAEYYHVPISTAIRWRAHILDRSKSRLWRSNREGVLAAVRLDLNPQQLAATLGISPGWVCYLRRQLNGAPKRDTALNDTRPMPLKWRTPAVVQVLQSGRTDSQNAAALGISAGHSRRLRIALKLHPELTQPEFVGLDAGAVNLSAPPLATQLG